MSFSRQIRDADKAALTETLFRGERELAAEDSQYLARPRRGRQAAVIVVATPYVLLVMLAIYTFLLHHRIATNPARYDQTLFSPAQDALRTEIKVFQQGFDKDITPYQGQPSPELDAKWKSLYGFGMTRISLQEAALLPNRTLMLPHQHDTREKGPEYLIVLDVFHQLHCLNMIRKTLYPSYYKLNDTGPDGEDELLGLSHIDHCIDSIRQSLMCHADVTPVIYSWSDRSSRYLAKTQVPHVCRVFEAVSAWASKHTLKQKIDMTIRQPNDPLDSSTWI